MVPSGRIMKLDKPFTVTVRGPKGQPIVREVKKLGATIVPLELALTQLKETFAKKEVRNPFGNAQVRVSDSSMNKVYEESSFTMIIEGLKKVTGSITVESGGSKRAREEEIGGKVREKKSRHDF
jgi:hypothetical protein